jgi:hypothetical protein
MTTTSTKARAAGRPPAPTGRVSSLRRAMVRAGSLWRVLVPAALGALSAACGTTYTHQVLISYDILVPGVACVPWPEAGPYLDKEEYHHDGGLAGTSFVEQRVVDGPFPEAIETAEEGLPPEAWSKTHCTYVVEEDWKNGIL